MFYQILTPSPNHSPRTQLVEFVIIHGISIFDESEALNLLCDKSAKVSCHYFIAQNGEIHQLVAENKMAWHAGVSAWGEFTSLNQNSIGIEISTPHKSCDRNSDFIEGRYQKCQYNSLIKLLNDIKTRHNIPPQNVLAHSDIATNRKTDPGIYFNWKILEKAGLAAPLTVTPNLTTAQLKQLGYRGRDKDILSAFKRRAEFNNIGLV